MGYTKNRNLYRVPYLQMLWVMVILISGIPCPRHITVPFGAEHLRATWPRPEQSHIHPEDCSPDGTDNNARDEASSARAQRHS